MNNEELIGLVDNLKELNEEIEKMNRNFNTNTLNSVSSCFSDVSNKASSLADSLSLVAENEDFIESVNDKLFPKVKGLDDVLRGVLGTCSSFLNVIPMLEIGFETASIAMGVLNETLRDKNLDKYYESCAKVSDELGSVTIFSYVKKATEVALFSIL